MRRPPEIKRRYEGERLPGTTNLLLCCGVDSLLEAYVFSTLDANSEHWHVEIEEKDREKTAFTSHRRLYCVLRIWFGFQNAPGTFPWTMGAALSAVIRQFALIYLENIVVFHRFPLEHVEHVRPVLILLNEGGVAMKLKILVNLRKLLTAWTTSFTGDASKLCPVRRMPFNSWKAHGLRRTKIFLRTLQRFWSVCIELCSNCVSTK